MGLIQGCVAHSQGNYLKRSNPAFPLGKTAEGLMSWQNV